MSYTIRAKRGIATLGLTVLLAIGATPAMALEANAAGASFGQAQSVAAVAKKTTGGKTTTKKKEAEKSPQQKAMASIAGWWCSVGGYGGSGAPRNAIYIEGNTVTAYNYGKECNTFTISEENVYQTTLLNSSGWYFDDLKVFLSDETPDILHRINADGSNYSGTGSLGRTDKRPW